MNRLHFLPNYLIKAQFFLTLMIHGSPIDCLSSQSNPLKNPAFSTIGVCDSLCLKNIDKSKANNSLLVLCFTLDNKGCHQKCIFLYFRECICMFICGVGRAVVENSLIYGSLLSISFRPKISSYQQWSSQSIFNHDNVF